MATAADKATQAAIERAKAIAAKFGSVGTVSETDDGSKRKRWDESSEGGKKPRTENTTSKRFWIATSANRPAAHFNSYLTSRFEDLADSMTKNRDELNIYLNGKGSNRPPPPAGMPQEPLHVILEGIPELVDCIDGQVHQLLRAAEQAPLEGVEGEDTRALVDTSAPTGQGLSSYRPASVAQMIGLQPTVAGDGPVIEREISVPNGVVGFIIGRGGENITSMQAKTGCKVQIQKEHELQPGQTKRQIILQGTSEQALDEVQSIIDGMVEDRVQSYGGGGGNEDPKVAAAMAQGHVLVPVDVPDADVGLVIGKMGSTIRHIQESTGANIQVPQQADPGKQTRTLQVTHPTQQGAEQAKAMILQLVESRRGSTNTSGPQTSIEVNIPDSDVGLCIGRQGCVIKHMQTTTNTRIQIPSHAIPGQSFRVATVTGTAEGCAQVQQMIHQISAEQSSAGVLHGSTSAYRQYGAVMAGANGTGAVGGDGAYSAEWAAYHAAQAAASQASGTACAPAAAPATNTPASAGASDQYYDQYFRYEYYYGEDAARAYYKTWSPPVGTPNPYGVNPNGITPAPAPTPTDSNTTDNGVTASSVDTTPANVQETGAGEARETSRRMVSNLPAWMTKK